MADLIAAPIETFNQLTGIGAMPPSMRLALGAGAVSAVAFVVKPKMWFTPSGSPKSWSVTCPNDADAVGFPWWMAAIATGGVLSAF